MEHSKLRATELLLALSLVSAGAADAQSWKSLEHRPPFGASTALLLTDGTVVCQEYLSSNWWRLTPNIFGNYQKGTWSRLASMPKEYNPLYYSSAVLADGRMIVAGGEYNNDFSNPVWTNKAAIYDPKTNTWTSLAPPPGWDNIGDAQNSVLPNGNFLLANALTSQIAELDPETLTWRAVGTGKADSNNEEGWTLLPDGTILTVDVGNAPHAERYIPWRGRWISAGETATSLVKDQEIGPAVLRPDGTVFATGGNQHTGIYEPSGNPWHPGTWLAGPDFPEVQGSRPLDVTDGPAALLPDGHVLVAARPDTYQIDTHFFEFDGSSLYEVPNIPDGPFITSFQGRMLLLPTGQVLFTDGGSDVEIYTSTGKPDRSWAPTIHVCKTHLRPGDTYKISGTQFNGLSQAVGYGDAVTAATNYPLVRITNCRTNRVFYCRTHDHSTMAVATGSDKVSTRFDVPQKIETGPSELEVVANGISSQPLRVFVRRECDRDDRTSESED